MCIFPQLRLHGNEPRPRENAMAVRSAEHEFRVRLGWPKPHACHVVETGAEDQVPRARLMKD